MIRRDVILRVCIIGVEMCSKLFPFIAVKRLSTAAAAAAAAEQLRRKYDGRGDVHSSVEIESSKNGYMHITAVCMFCYLFAAALGSTYHRSGQNTTGSSARSVSAV